MRQAQYHRVPAGPLTGVRVLDLSRLSAGNMLTHILADFGAEAGALPMHHVAPVLSETPGAVHSPAPALGEHARAVLLDAGYGEREIEEMGRESVL